jgi:hypothetical protein
MFVDEVRDLSPLTAKVSKNKVKDKVKDKKKDKTKGNQQDLKKERVLDEDERLNYLEMNKDPLHLRRSATGREQGREGRHLLQSSMNDNVTIDSADYHRYLADSTEAVITGPKLVDGRLQYPWELQGRHVIPDPYDFNRFQRAPIISIGYTAYLRDSQTYFTGSRIGGAFIDKHVFFRHWRKALTQQIVTPFIAVCSLNENWGFLSTKFPNRTASWGQCCASSPKDAIIMDYLNHEKTLMLVTNQHTNVSHAKLLILPRGIPVTWGFTRLVLWDSMRLVDERSRDPSHELHTSSLKQILLFAASSSWGPRPQILACISRNFPVSDFSGHVSNPAANQRYEREDYYMKLASARFGLGLPGLGYDCFRNWELMTMGTIVVLEKAVGLDRTVSHIIYFYLGLMLLDYMLYIILYYFI